MDKSMMIGIVAGAVAVTAVGGVAGYKAMKGPDYAEVMSATEVTEKVRTPREECRDVAVTEQAPVKDEHRIAGTAIGAVLGGVVGNQIGGGKGKTLATVAGAAGGGYAGNQVQKNMQESDRVTKMERRCKTVYDTSTRSVGYDVTYKLGDKQETIRMDHNPGSRIPVEDGQLVLTPPATTKNRS
ncbi:MAG: glycine zipper 2TM domain-containing protein [Thiobacillus sp.]|nr:glycine zipper 2TM domain-containing protein [Thiobacillus sp.]